MLDIRMINIKRTIIIVSIIITVSMKTAEVIIKDERKTVDSCLYRLQTTDLTPVSYTHLDVYKRQVYSSQWTVEDERREDEQ